MATSATRIFGRRRVPVLLAGTALAAACAASAETGPASLGVSVIIQPKCAISAPSRLRLAHAAVRKTMMKPAQVLEIACTTGASWSVDTADKQNSLAALFSPASPVGLGEGDGPTFAARLKTARPGAERDPADVVRVTVRY